ncbi:uncharacterized protein SPPG_09488 [Spizellomyces punctatus DAOM BR117]|uniref:Uncharacterized protein n=1 Tax=Spizellomyces punctatus (strain DAOM BR117) TaxID=645134 RepID=A0A0L0H7G8_SPIPD|nr:uncharacterized protein SPPG_09488 [Spizellomyces punctatus DAOM BR117]KNC96841.1 hypothetical protein SPPG_09488 [Spizellomyces punctatus DAOM BR117]|eukprot:XP_016604881.1 hypothetical protein SPPG_09488 [Spizellomyces punctatus DAOM BR117]
MPDIDEREKPILQQFKEVVLDKPTSEPKTASHESRLTQGFGPTPLRDTNAPSIEKSSVPSNARPGDSRVNPSSRD